MKRKIAFFRDETHSEGIIKSKTYSQHLLSIVFLFLLFGLSINSVFAQQADLRLLTDAYTAGQCPANDIRVLSASIDTGNPCNTCTEGPVTADFTIRINHNTESGGRHLAICGTIIETLPGGGTVNHNLSMCFGPLLKSSEQIGGGQDLAAGQLTFTCGSTLELTNILLVWTAANGECPVTLANNPNGKYCWNNPNVNIPTAIRATVVPTNAVCFGSATGSIDLTVTGGVSPFTYVWTASGSGVVPALQVNHQDLTGLVAGTYSVTVTDSHNCSVTKSGITIGQNPETFPDISKSPGSASTQCGVSSATAQAAINTAFNAWLANATPLDPNDVEENGVVVVNGGAPSHTITRSPLNPTAPSYSGGSTSVTWTITDACGKQDTVTAAFTVTNNCRIICETTPTAVTCHGLSTGSIAVSGSAGFPPYTFDLRHTDLTPVAGQNSITSNTNPGVATFSNLPAGVYTILITDSVQDINDPTVCADATITEPDAVTLTASHTDVTCNGLADGKLTVDSFSGTGTPSFYLKTGAGAFVATTEAAIEAGNFGPNTYVIKVTYPAGSGGGVCEATETETITQPDAVTLVASHTDATCNGQADGRLTIDSFSGTGTASFYLKTGAGAFVATTEAAIEAGSYGPETYVIKVTYPAGSGGGVCEKTETEVIGQPGNVTLSASHLDVTCNGLADGKLSIDSFSGTGTPSFYLKTGAGAFVATTEAAIEAGSYEPNTYVIKVTYPAGSGGGVCEATETEIIGQPDAVTLVASHTNVTCNSLADGKLTVDSFSGTGTPSFYLKTGAGAFVATTEAAIEAGNFGPNTYVIKVTYPAGSGGGVCEATETEVIGQPDAVTLVASHSNVTCNGLTNGRLTVDSFSGTGTPSFYLKTGAGSFVATTEAAIEAGSYGANTYVVKVTYPAGSGGGVCEATETEIITQPDATLDLVSLSPTSASCSGGDGTILATISGGTSPYTIKLDATAPLAVVGNTYTFTGVAAGPHTVTVYDANYAVGSQTGCTDSGNVTIDAVSCGGHIFPTQTTCCNYTSGISPQLLQACTTVSRNVVTNAIPGVFFYYSYVVAPAANFTIDVKQTNDGDLNKLFNVQNDRQIRLFTQGCGNNINFTKSIVNGSDAHYNVMGATPGATYIVSVKYDVKSILGAIYSGGDMVSTFSFSSYTKVGANPIQLVAGSSGSLNVVSGCRDNTPLPGACSSALDTTSDNPSSGVSEAMFTAYPIPFGESINVRYEFDYQSKARIEVYDAKGLFVMSYDDADAYFNKEVRLDVTFNHGEGQMFFVKVITDKGVSTKKIVSKN